MSQTLIPDPQVCKRYGVVPMTLHRWDRDPNLGFPKPIYIRKRKYRNAAELDAFDEAQRRKADSFSEQEARADV